MVSSSTWTTAFVVLSLGKATCDANRRHDNVQSSGSSRSNPHTDKGAFWAYRGEIFGYCMPVGVQRTVLHCCTYFSIYQYLVLTVHVLYNVSCQQQYRERQQTHQGTMYRYGEHCEIIAFPICSWRVESGPQQGRLEAVRYSPRAVLMRLGLPACLL